MTEFVTQINKYTLLTKEAENDFLSKLKSKFYKKGEIISKEGQICKQLYFIESGLVKQYYYHNDRLFILRFFSENNIFTVLDSFINQIPADFLTIALEDSELIYIEYYDVQELAKKHHSFETFLRNIFSYAALYNLNRIKYYMKEKWVVIITAKVIITKMKCTKEQLCPYFRTRFTSINI